MIAASYRAGQFCFGAVAEASAVCEPQRRAKTKRGLVVLVGQNLFSFL